MKANFFGAVILCAISLTQGSEYKYLYDNNKTCIDVKMDVLFTLSNGSETVKFDGNNFTVNSGDCANEGEYQAVLRLGNPNDDFLVMTFNAEPDLFVNMSLMFTFAPFEFFPGTPIATAINMVDTGDLKLGEDTQLYQCESSQRMTLTGELEGTTYTMFMDMSNVQIQAFNITNGKLSTDVFVCSADQMTTAAQQTTEASNSSTGPTQPSTEPTTKPTTANVTEPPSNVTTVGPSNVTTEGPTTAPITVTPTTSPTPSYPPKSTYKVMENSKACLIMEGSFLLNVKYTKKDNTTAQMTVVVPPSSNDTVTGTCASGNDTESSLTITPKDGEIKSFTFNFKVINGKSNLESWSAELNLTMFPDAKESELNHTVSGKPVELSSPKLFFKCEKEGSFFDDILNFMFQTIKVQAFNVEDEKFSDNGYDCKADVGPIPNPGSPPLNTYSFSNGNNTCIVFKGKIQLNIPYVSTNGNATEVVSLPVNFTVDGDCNTTLDGFYAQRLDIMFYENWKLSMTFSSDKKRNLDLLTAEAGVTNYHISEIELVYDYNNNLFKDVDESIVGKTETVTATNQTFLSTSASKSYMCSKDTTFALPNGLTMVTKDLQFQAFKDGNTTDFSAATECAGDEDTNSIVPIAVGAALAGLVIIVLIAYLIGRKRSRSGYEQV